MPAQWLSSTNDIVDRASQVLESTVRGLSQPARARRLRRLVIGLLLVWLLFSLARLVWGLLPAEEAKLSEVDIINPAPRTEVQASALPVDIEQMRAWHLFGEAGALDEAVVAATAEPTAVDAREGIEKGARETRLQLRLRGVVASTEQGLGHAIIEYQNKQAVYAVEDELPVGANVTLAKVMPQQVVIDNNGTYELLPLYAESALDKQFRSRTQAPTSRPAAPRGAATGADRRDDTRASDLARSYRERLYENPQSLAEVVSVNAVRSEGELQGYRIAPGRDAEQFRQLGFKPGDLVTSINGIALNDPANTMRLYQAMRTAKEAVFELERGEQSVSVSVRLDDVGE